MDTQRSDTRSVNQLATGQISADEAARRLHEPADLTEAQAAPSTPKTALTNRWLHVRVTSLETGKPKVNVNLPLAWVEMGMKIGARYSPEVAGFDVREIVEQIQAGADGKLVEVEDLVDGERVEIFVD